ncbi:TIGR03747 family integrating conjugative element membrane protein [Pseudomonas veronii]
MSDPANTAQRQQTQQQGLITGIITLPFRFVAVLLGSLFLSIVIECVGMHLFWADQGWRHAQGMLDYELTQLSQHFTRSAVVQEPGQTASWLVETAYQWVFVKSGLIDWMRDASAKASSPSQGTGRDFRFYLSQVYVYLENDLIASAYTLLVFLVRLLVLVHHPTIPDGSFRRTGRWPSAAGHQALCAGRESGFVYHRAKASLMPLAVMPWVLYLTLPVSAHPLLILVPCAILLGAATDLAAGSFKKYL